MFLDDLLEHELAVILKSWSTNIFTTIHPYTYLGYHIAVSARDQWPSSQEAPGYEATFQIPTNVSAN